jgi:hypothetical protein
VRLADRHLGPRLRLQAGRRRGEFVDLKSSFSRQNIID